MNEEINLLPGKTKLTSSVLRKRQILHSIALGLLFVVSFLSVTLFILIALSPLPSLREREQEEYKRLTFYNEMIVKLLLTKDRIVNIQDVLKTRSVYSATLQDMGMKVPAGVTMDEVYLENNTLLVTLSSSSLVQIDQFLETLLESYRDSKIFKTIKLVSLQQDFKKGLYKITLEFI